MGEEHAARDVVGNFLAFGLRKHRHAGVENLVAAVPDDGRERSDFVGVHNDFAEVALNFIGGFRARGAAHGHDGGRDERSGSERCFEKTRHGCFLFRIMKWSGTGSVMQRLPRTARIHAAIRASDRVLRTICLGSSGYPW